MHFALLNRMAQRLNLDLSMGMSGDYIEAIEFGAHLYVWGQQFSVCVTIKFCQLDVLYGSFWFLHIRCYVG